MSIPLSAGRAVTQVMYRCECAKENNLSSCSLMYVADAIYHVLKDHEVKKCSLANNSLKKFPTKMVSKFPDIIQFSIAGNEISEVPEAITGWKNLRAVNLASNCLESFPETIFELKQLNILDLSHNQLKDIDIDRIYEHLPQLKMINISNNQIPQDRLDEIISFSKSNNDRVKIQYLASNPD